MTARADAPAAADPVSQTQQHIRHLSEQALRLVVADLAPPEFCAQFLQRILAALAASFGTLWLRNPAGDFEQQAQQNPGGVERERIQDAAGRSALLQQAVAHARPVYFPPGDVETEAVAAGPARSGLVEWGILFVPVLLDGAVAGFIEVWHGRQREAQAVPALLQFLVRMADLVAVYLVQQQQKQPSDAQLWAQLNAFTTRIHGTLNPMEAAYLIANEGRQLIGCERLTVALRPHRRAVVEAISGVDHVDQRANLVRRLRRLCDRTLDWGERLIYRGTPDDSLPPAVVQELDGYLEESHTKLLIILPLRDARETKNKQPPRAALVAECFATAVAVEQQVARLEAIARHATAALYNSSAYRQIPLRFLWGPVARVQAGLGGKTKAIAALVAVLVVLLTAALVFVPYPLKMDARGQLLPEQRRWLYAPVEGQVVRFAEGVQPGSAVAENQSLVLLYDVQLETRLVQLTQEIAAAQQDVDALTKQQNVAATEADRLRYSAEKKGREALRDRKFTELRTLRQRVHADDARPGYFWLKAPAAGTVLNWDFRETLTNRLVKPSEPLLRLGDKTKRWEAELKIPQQHMGQIVQAFARHGATAELDVDLLVVSAPTRTYRGKLARAKLAGEASPDAAAPDAAPVVQATVRIDGPDIPASERIPPELLITGTEVHVKVRCGERALGYALFHGLWEFIYEKVIFFF